MKRIRLDEYCIAEIPDLLAMLFATSNLLLLKYLGPESTDI